MDDIEFYYQPLSASRSRPRLPGAVTASNAPERPAVSHSGLPKASLNQQYETSKDPLNESRDMSDSSQKMHASDRHRRSDKFQEQEDLRATRHSPNGNDDDEYDFPDINELLSGIRQKSVAASADANSGGIADIVDNGTQGDSHVDSSRSTVGSTQDPIILSDDESVSAESETDYSDLDVDLRAKSGSIPPYVSDSELADSNSFASRAILTSDCLVTDYQDDDKNHNNGVVDNAKLRLSADLLRSASPGHGSIKHQANKPQANTNITQGSTSSVHLDISMELEDKDFDVFAEGTGEDDDGTHSTKGQELSPVSDNILASDSNIPKLQASQPGSAQSPQLSLTAASLHRSDSKNDHSPKQLRRRDAARNDRRKRRRTTALVGLASTTSTVSTALEATNLKEAQPRAQITAPDKERTPRDVDLEVDNNGSTDDSNDEDYTNKSNAASSRIEGRPRHLEGLRRTKDTEDKDVATHSTPPLEVSYQAPAVISPGSMHESEDIPIHGYFTLKTVESKVVYCLTFSQELLSRTQDRRRRQDRTTDLEEPQSVAPVTDPNYEWGVRKIIDQKMIGHERHYQVEWKDTWMSESELAGAKELVDAFMVNDRSGGRSRPLKRGRPATGQPDARGEEPKRRGRPRKQT